jgi:hypothetical protein
VQFRVGGLVRPDHVLHREPGVDEVPVRGDVRDGGLEGMVWLY